MINISVRYNDIMRGLFSEGLLQLRQLPERLLLQQGPPDKALEIETSDLMLPAEKIDQWGESLWTAQEKIPI